MFQVDKTDIAFHEFRQSQERCDCSVESHCSTCAPLKTAFVSGEIFGFKEARGIMNV